MIPFTGLELPELVQAVGYVGLVSIVFLESGIPIGFFLPGDTLLFTAGLLAALGTFNLYALILLAVIAAILGDSAGYWLGKKFGRALFANDTARVLSAKNLARTEAFYAKHGAKAVILARFVPVVRTFVPLLAGVGTMPYRTFVKYNVAGAILWGAGVPLLGYFLGTLIPDIDRYLIPIVLVLAAISFLPVLRELFKKPA